MESFECDVVIVGAGLSGLSAAYYLVKTDRRLRISILEAKDRIGGRTLTKQLAAADGSKDFWDLGGEWGGRPQPHLNYLLKKFQVNEFQSVAPTSGRKTSDVHSLPWLVYLDLWQFKWKLQRLQKKLKSSGLDSTWQTHPLDEIILATFMEESLWTSKAKTVLESACHGLFGITPSEMTLCYFLMYVESAGGLDVLLTPEEFNGKEFRVKGGMQQLCNHLMNRIGKQQVYLSQPVTHIVQAIEGARVSTANGLHILCQRVIMAVPPHHTAAIDYVPELPPAKLDLLKSIPLAFLIKFTITYESAFWRKGKNSQPRGFQALLSDSHLGPIGLVYEAMSGRGNPALAGFISHADQIDPDPKNRRYLILCLIEQHLGPLCQQHLEFSLMDWSLEPYNGGCFLKNFIPETFKFCGNVLRAPFDRIHFAGTESATVWCGFMNGAIQSGFRAASEVIYHLRPMISPTPFPEKETKKDIKSTTNKVSSNWLVWLAAGAGITSFVYLYCKSNENSQASDIFVRNIRLVFDPLRS